MQPAAMVNGEVIRCALCRTDDYGLPDHKLGEHHVSTRFDHHSAYRNIRVLLDGRDVTDDCMEYYTGVDSWVALYARNRAGRRYFCGHDYSHAVVVKHRGSVVVKRRS